jgi:hypothetical protein
VPIALSEEVDLWKVFRVGAATIRCSDMSSLPASSTILSTERPGTSELASAPAPRSRSTMSILPSVTALFKAVDW